MSTTNRERYRHTCDLARQRSLKPDYEDCAVYVVPVVHVSGGEPEIIGYNTTDYYDPSVITRFVNGEQTLV